MEERLFLKEINKQIKFALIAFEDLENELLRGHSGNLDRIWYSIQSFLTSSGNVSKILFGAKNTSTIKKRAKLLKSILNINDGSVLKTRKMRNVFEHFDEKLDAFIESSSKNNVYFVDSNIGPINAIRIEGLSEETYLRNIDPHKMEVTFMDINYNIRDVLDSLIDLKKIVDKELA